MPWSTKPLHLCDGLDKAEATALFLLRVELIGLNQWLEFVGVPDISRRCASGWPAQTVRHTLLHCPLHQRGELRTRLTLERLEEILSRQASARAAARRLIQSGILKQFDGYKGIKGEDTTGHRPR